MTLLIVMLALAWSTPQTPGQTAPTPDSLEQIACAPGGLSAPPAASTRVLGGYVHGRIMFGPGDAVIIGGGAQGLQKGQQYFVRRLLHDASARQPKVGALYGVHTAGWVTVVDVKDSLAVATVTHACDGVLEGDYLEPYVPPVEPSAALKGAPDFEHPGHIVLADERRQTGASGVVMLMDRGIDDGVRGGQMLTIYRESLQGMGPNIDVGRATVLSANAKSAVIRVESSREGVYLGDLVAIHRITQ